MDQPVDKFTIQPLGTLTIVVGLPGSGKSTYIHSLTESNSNLSVYDDYQGESYEKSDDPRLSKHFKPLTQDLMQAKRVIVSDIRYCIPRELNAFLAAVLNVAPNVQIEFTFFENNPEACRRNIIARNRPDRVEKELELLKKLSAGYSVPAIEGLKVYDSE